MPRLLLLSALMLCATVLAGTPSCTWAQKAEAADAMEGVWEIEVQKESGAEKWFAALSRGFQGVSLRKPETGWTLVGRFRTYPVTPHSVTSSSISTAFYDGDLSGAMRVNAISPGLLRGHWSKNDKTSPAVWRKLARPQLNSVEFNSNWTDEQGQPVIHTVEVGDDGNPQRNGRFERKHPVTCGAGMRGNCARVFITLRGRHLAQPIPLSFDGPPELELLDTRFVWGDGARSFPTDAAMKWIITGETEVEAIQLTFAIWDGLAPGTWSFKVGAQEIPFEIVIHGHPNNPPTSAPQPDPLPPSGEVPVLGAIRNIDAPVDLSRCTCDYITLARVDAKDYAGEDTSIWRRIGFGEPGRYTYQTTTVYQLGDSSSPPEAGPLTIPRREYLDQMCFYFSYPQELAYTTEEGREGLCRSVVEITYPHSRTAAGARTDTWQLYSVRGLPGLQTHAKNNVCIAVGTKHRTIPPGSGKVSWSVDGKMCPASPVELTIK